MYGGAPRSGGLKAETTGNATFSPAVSRSSELLASAKTAIKVARSQNSGVANPADVNPPWWTTNPNVLRLSSIADIPSSSPVVAMCEDGLSLLRSMQGTLVKLQGLVRRRGHTNDPTHQISVCTKQLETDAKELATTVQSLQTIPTKHSQQYKKHLQLVSTWLQQVASSQSTELKEILKLRGSVLADQAQRRKLLNPSISSGKKGSTGALSRGRPGASNGISPNANPAIMMNSPLFTQTQNSTHTSRRPAAATSLNGTTSQSLNGRHSTGNGHANHSSPRATATASPYYNSSTTSGGYGGYGGAGYGGGGYGGTPQTGIRQRRGGGASTSTPNPYQQQPPADDATNVQNQIQQRQMQRQTQNRLESARQTESTLYELGTVFGKMSQLISQQGEVLEKVEDDVEAAVVDVTAGQNEIQVLYQMKKGNRGLIIKVFAIVIFFVVFLRFY